MRIFRTPLTIPPDPFVRTICTAYFVKVLDVCSSSVRLVIKLLQFIFTGAVLTWATAQIDLYSIKPQGQKV